MDKILRKADLSGAVIVGAGIQYPRTANVYIGDDKNGYERGDLVDANAVIDIVDNGDTQDQKDIKKLREDLTIVENKIPEEASSSNQLADKAYVNNGIATNSATFRGTYQSVSELDNVEADNNDYAFVVRTDIQGNSYYDRYKYVEGTGWQYEFTIKNISLYVLITWSELKQLRDSDKLIPGTFYRITDFVTTTTQDNTQSAEHAFDIIVVADDVNVLNENARAIKHSDDTYFADSKLEAWELKYCLDNDTIRFVWADDTNGKGVIYYMKDEFENECPYDFKNIMFERWWGNEIKTTSQKATEDLISTMEDMFVNHYHSYSSSDLPLGNGDLVVKIDSNNSKFFYTFSLCSEDGETFESDDNETVYDGSLKHYGSNMYTNNVIKEYLPFDENDIIHKLNNIVFKPIDSSADDCENNVFGKNCYDMTIGFSWTHDNIFGSDCYCSTFGCNCENNSFGNYYGNNTFGNGSSVNTFENSCSGNTFGDGCNCNSFGNNCYNNSFGNGCENNSFGNNCYSNLFGHDCENNSFGNGCDSNTFGDECNGNSFMNECNNNSFEESCSNNTFGNSCGYNTFVDGCYNNSFGSNCGSNTFVNDCNSNSFGNECNGNSFGTDCYYNSFGNSCNSITFAKDYMYYNIVENGNQNIEVTSTQTTSFVDRLQNIKIAQGVNNTTTAKTISHNTVNDTFLTIYKPTNSVEVSV